MKHDEWLTPPEILRPLGQFDLDPCAPIMRPWDTAAKHMNVNDDGLSHPWHGRVWCNPPFGREAVKWLNRMAQHGNGIALVPARTETAMFYACVWGVADAVLFIKGRPTFTTHRASGPRSTVARRSASSPTGNTTLTCCGLPGLGMSSTRKTHHDKPHPTRASARSAALHQEASNH